MIYVIIGKSGEFSDHAEWPVCWRPTLEEAQALIPRLTSEAKAYQELEESPEGTPSRLSELLRTMLDPYFGGDGWGKATYHVWAVPDDPVNERIAGTNNPFEINGP